MGGRPKLIEYTCIQCGKIFISRIRYDREVKFCSHKCYGESKKGNVAWNNGIPMREESKNKLSEKNKGKFSGYTPFKKGQKPHNFKGYYITTQGYRFIHIPDHRMANIRGYVPAQNIVMEKKIGRYLKKNEIVHHKDHNKLNNDIENLELMDRKDHFRLHYSLRTKNKNGTLS